MRRALNGLGIVALTGGLLVGCGDDDGGTAAGDTSEAEFCARAGALQERFGNLDDTASEPSPELFRDVSEAFADLADDAPDEIRDDIDTLATALATFAEVFEDIDLDDPASLAVLEEEAERLEEQSEDLEEAGDNVEAYVRDECGIELGGDDGPEGDATTTTREGDATTTTDGPTRSDELNEVLEDE